MGTGGGQISRLMLGWGVVAEGVQDGRKRRCCCICLLLSLFRWYRPDPDAPWGGSCLNGLYIFCPLSTVLNLSNFCYLIVPQARLGRVEVPLTQDALPTRRGVMTPPALRHRAVPPLVDAAEA